MKKYFLIFSIIIFFFYNYPTASASCSEEGYSVFVINGMFAREKEAVRNSDTLRKLLPVYLNKEKVFVNYLYNPSHVGGVADLFTGAYQKLFDTETVRDYNLVEMLKEASEKTDTQKILLIGHSQGNFYANSFHDSVIEKDEINTDSIGVYSVATPSSRVAGGGKYITSDTDKVINFIRTGGAINILPANVKIKLSPEDNQNGHAFSEVYLKYQGNKIISDIKTSLAELSARETQDKDIPCLIPPETGLIHKTAERILSVIDPLALASKSVIQNTVEGVDFAAEAFSDGVFSFVGTLEKVVDNISGKGRATAVVYNQPDNLNKKDNEPEPIQEEENIYTEPIPEEEEKTEVQEEIKEPEYETTTQNPVIILAETEEPSPQTTEKETSRRRRSGGGGGGASIPKEEPEEENTEEEPLEETQPEESEEETDTEEENPEETEEQEEETLPEEEQETPDSASEDPDEVIDSDTVFSAGEYHFNNLTVTNNATLKLEGDPDSLNDFKGVKIFAKNLVLETGSHISADGEGYETGPGSSPQIGIGASYGGVGGDNEPETIYGSAMAPTDLGSGVLGNSSGGGAIWLTVEESLQVDGDISADGLLHGGSGGSIYITTENFSGSGNIQANGGDVDWPLTHTGGGGRIAIHYDNSSFTGTVSARAGLYCFYGCNPAGGSGTVGFFNTSTNNLTVTSFWRFQKNDEPFDFNKITLKNSSEAVIEENTEITSESFLIDESSSLSLLDDQSLSVSEFTLDGGSTLILSDSHSFMADTLILSGNSTITSPAETPLYLESGNITIETGSSISTDAKGYISGPGSPTADFEGGASYGGKGGGNTLPIYGSAEEPTDLGSGTENNPGGGAIRLIVSGELKNNGTISSNGKSQRTSGGSIYVTTGTLTGSGAFQANGGKGSWPHASAGAGGGGRIALFYDDSSFSGEVKAAGGEYCFSGCSPAAQDGTIVTSDEPLLPEEPDPEPENNYPEILNYTFNETTGDINIDPTLNPVEIFLTAGEEVNWKSIKIENVENSDMYKIFYSGNGCEDDTATCQKTWDGSLSPAEAVLTEGTYRVKVHIEDSLGNSFNDYLPSTITVSFQG